MADDSEKSLVFISYSHKDEIWKDRLRPHLDMFSFDSELVVWDDRQIEPSAAWFDDIKDIMERAKVAICLMSPDYLASSFCRNHEIPYLLGRHAKGDMVLIFILVRPCAWNKLPWLAALQILPRDNKAISKHYAEDWDTPFTEIASYVVDQLGADEIRKCIRAYDPIEPDEHENPLQDWIDLTRLPTSGFDVVGRNEELQFLNEAFDGTKLNVVSLRAWGGVGKSTLVNKWCEYLAADNYRGAYRVFAWSFYSQGTSERVTSADAFIDEALRFFGEGGPAQGSPWARGERLAEQVGKQKTLLILDGMEPLQDKHQGIKDPALARLVECLAEKNTGLCLITTREPVKEFADFPETTEEIDLEQLSKEAGRALLRIKGLRADDDLLEQASEAFGNHALALDLLASYLTRFTSGDVSQALKIPALPDMTVDDGRHPRRVMAAFAEEFGEGPELDLLHVMGLFDRPANTGCIDALRKPPTIPGLTDHLVRESSDMLAMWWRRSMNRSDAPSPDAIWEKLVGHLRNLGLLAKASRHKPDDLDAHPLVREHFGTELRDEWKSASKAGHDRLYEHLESVPEKDRPDTLAEMAPLFQAIHHGCAAGRYQEAFDEVYWSRISRENSFYLARALGGIGANFGAISAFFDEPGRHPNPAMHDPAKRFLIVESGINLRSLGRPQEALIFHKLALEDAIERENWTKAAIQASSISRLHLSLGKVDRAVTLAREAVQHIGRTDTDSRRSVTTRAALANALHQRGAFELSLAWFEEAEVLQRQREPDFPLLSGLQGYDYCQLLLSLRRAHDVPDRATYALEVVSKHADNLADVALNLISLGRAAMALGQHEEADRQLHAGVDGLRHATRFDQIPHGLLARAGLFSQRGECARSRRDIAEAMRIATRSGMRLHVCDAHLEYARLAIAEDDPDAALPHFRAADALVTECGYHRRDPELLDLREKLKL